MSIKQRLLVSHLSVALAATSMGLIPNLALGQAMLHGYGPLLSRAIATDQD